MFKCRDLFQLMLKPEQVKKYFEALLERVDKAGEVTAIACIDSRGYIIGSVVAFLKKIPLIAVRKSRGDQNASPDYVRHKYKTGKGEVSCIAAYRLEYLGTLEWFELCALEPPLKRNLVFTKSYQYVLMCC